MGGQNELKSVHMKLKGTFLLDSSGASPAVRVRMLNSQDESGTMDAGNGNAHALVVSGFFSR